ncbi:MAG: class I SAM-dependent methyltransferase, partial [Planctomycetota bacterium]
GDHPALELVCNDGQDLGFVGDETIDFIWSFDVFVHLEKPEVAAYFAHFKRVLRPGGLGVVHYATLDRAPLAERKVGWRAEFTSGDMFALLKEHGLRIVQDFYDPHISFANSSVIVFRKE